MSIYNFRYIFILLCLSFSCSSDDVSENDESILPDPDVSVFNILSLGDSYTIGESVCQSCSFPVQLKDELNQRYEQLEFKVDILAQTGWTTTNLLTASAQVSPDSNFDFVTLLIGVNNQFQGLPFTIYQDEFSELLQSAIDFAGGNRDKVLVISIPDYAFTPFGQSRSDREEISNEIDSYNNFAKGLAEDSNVRFLNITDITRQGLNDPDLVASDGLHPSEKAYTMFVDRILPRVVSNIN